MNTYFVAINIYDKFNPKINLISIFKLLSDNFFLNKIEYENLLKINYLKTTVLTLLKNIVYSYVYKNYIIFKFKSNFKIENWYDDIIVYLNDNNFLSLLKFINKFNDYMISSINFRRNKFYFINQKN